MEPDEDRPFPTFSATLMNAQSRLNPTMVEFRWILARGVPLFPKERTLTSLILVSLRFMIRYEEDLSKDVIHSTMTGV